MATHQGFGGYEEDGGRAGAGKQVSMHHGAVRALMASMDSGVFR
jgi:hypothetical protein